MASFTPTDSSPTISGNSSSASSSCGSKSSWVNGSIVGDSADASIDGMSSASIRMARWAYDPTSKPVPCWRSYMFVSMSRTIGKPTSLVVSSKRGTGPDVDHLVDRRGERDRRPGHPGDPRAPHAACDDDGVGRDVAPVGADAPDVAVDHVDAGDLDLGRDRQGTQRLGCLAHQRAGLERVDDADARRVEAAEDHRLVDERDHLLDLGRRQQPGALDAPRGRRRHPTLELLHALRRPRDLDAAGLVIDAELAVLVGAVDREGRHLLGVVGQEDEVRRVPGGPTGARERALVEQHDVPPAQPGEVVDHAVADDSRADDDDVRPRRERAHAGPSSDAPPRDVPGHDVPDEDTRPSDPERGTGP